MTLLRRRERMRRSRRNWRTIRRGRRRILRVKGLKVMSGWEERAKTSRDYPRW